MIVGCKNTIVSIVGILMLCAATFGFKGEERTTHFKWYWGLLVVNCTLYFILG